MKEFINLLNLLGIHVNINESSSPVLLFAFSILVLSFISLICIINILLYLGVIYISDNKKILEKISQSVLLLKLFNLYKKTRIFYIVIEFMVLLFTLGSVIWLCLRVVTGLLK